ncbi:acyltransferase family protein [Dactylosporangium matsuzakiense]|uniref:Integral membrane transferase n=1 Tax=Dactylosporangium matsuzakiense TaxID=53360 RepID=A0A9W6KPL8_9ACTN|nr:acyltransferase [Dactylosporangium matsuzakiense]UWZ43420.1 acyltransferase [Dactylosporangium matsuzakiense]GLL05866.1 integral membrane transferase [Dactylosporangium matsuzakiense]
MRNRYVDLLRAVAIIRVVTYHTLGFAWLTVAFPAMGLMFALGGSLMAASLDRSGVKAIGRRMRRIIIPFWVLGVFAIALMSLWGGMEHTWRTLLWFVPLDDPPTTEKGGLWFSQIWYVRSYLWFIIASPVLLWVFRKWPIPSVLVPFSVLVILWETGYGTGGMVRDFFMYAPAWMLGFAHHDGTLQRISKKILWPVCLVMGGIGLAILFHTPGPRGYDLNDAPIADTLYSTAFLLIMLNAAPAAMSLGVAEPLVEAVNRRALTIYLWHEAAITFVRLVGVWLGINLVGGWNSTLQFTMVVVLTAILVLAFGWVEDLAAKRKPQIIPTPKRVVIPRVVEEPQPVLA